MTPLVAAAAGVAGGLAIFPAMRLLDLAVGRIVLRPALRRRLADASRGSVVLTYDDGPSGRFQDTLLDLLARRGARATFYLLESRAQGQRDRIDALRSGGHEIATHSFGHLDAHRAGPRAACADLAEGLAVCSAEERPVRRFRPPRGRVSLSTYVAARRSGLAFDLWTLDSGDTFARTPSVAEVVQAAEAAGGCVALLHSHDRAGTRPDAEAHALAVTEALIDLGARRGWPIKRMRDLAD